MRQLLLLLFVSCSLARAQQESTNATTSPYLIAYKNDVVLPQSLLSRRRRVGKHLSNALVLQAELTEDELNQVQNDTNVLYVEEDALVYRFKGGEVIPYALPLIQPLQQTPTTSSSSSSSSFNTCDNDSSFKVAIIDSGVDASHMDLACRFNNCQGVEYGISSSFSWDTPVDSHGTLVAGIIGAVHDNAVGVQGVVADVADVCYIVVRVFGSDEDAARISDILDAVEYAVDQGASVINLSLGGPVPSTSARDLYDQLYERENVLVVAAAGNDGSTDYSYPASYDSVISVGAVDANRQHADFSQSNDQVDLVAPGVSILSTVPMGLSEIIVVSVGDDMAVTGIMLALSPELSSLTATTGKLVYCGDYGQDVCPGDGGHVCLIERGVATFETKALNCQASGGAAVVIYNNQVGQVAGTLSNPSSVTIPVVAVTQNDGLSLLQQVEMSVALSRQDGYGYADGTSFAAPFVAGAATAIWKACRDCTNFQVKTCLEDTALDLGDTGYDEEFGHGLVQVQQAYECLIFQEQCCEESSFSGGGTPAPTVDDADDCTMAEFNYQRCFAEELDSLQGASCRTCVNSRIPDPIDSVSCGELESQICPAIVTNCDDCAPCRTDIETYLGCVISDLVPGCDFGCDPSSTGIGDVVSPIDAPLLCQTALQDMERCFRAEVMRQSSSSTVALLEDDNSCEACIRNALPTNLGDYACRDLAEETCVGLDACESCMQCRPEMDRFVNCVGVASVGCRIDCEVLNLGGASNNTTTSAAPAVWTRCWQLILVAVAASSLFFS